MKPSILKTLDVMKEPYLFWNTFIEMLACGDVSEMNDIQNESVFTLSF